MSASAARDGARISGPGDVARALTVVRERAAQRTVTADLRQAVGTAADEAVRESLPVPVGLQQLLPAGLSAGSTIALSTGQGATSLLIAALSRATAAGQWIGVVGLPQLGLAAVAEAGADLERVALVPDPHHLWAEVIAALCDGLALVAFAVPSGVPEHMVRALTARARKSRCVLIPFGGPWSGADLILQPAGRQWHMPSRRRLPRCFDLDVTVRGRGGASRPRTQPVHLPLGVGEHNCPRTSAARPRLRLVDAADHPLDEPSRSRALVRS